MWMGDPPEELARFAPLIGAVELAEKEKRTPPGVTGDDFRPYFAALARGGFSGRMDIEATGTPEQFRDAFAIVRRQVAEATAAI
jgi:sugar phosphate isomerase/epimerase